MCCEHLPATRTPHLPRSSRQDLETTEQTHLTGVMNATSQVSSEEKTQLSSRPRQAANLDAVGSFAFCRRCKGAFRGVQDKVPFGRTPSKACCDHKMNWLHVPNACNIVHVHNKTPYKLHGTSLLCCRNVHDIHHQALPLKNPTIYTITGYWQTIQTLSPLGLGFGLLHKPDKILNHALKSLLVAYGGFFALQPILKECVRHGSGRL